jgi:hypothetical protein
MNPQPHPIVGEFFAFIIMLLTAFYAYKAYIQGKSINLNELDIFTIGYIEETPPAQITHVVEKHFHKTKTKRVIETKPSFESQQLYVDCIDALVALGVKKKDAKTRAEFIFSSINPQPSTVQEFLIIALRNI